MASADITAASTYRHKLTATKDGSTWDLTGATITLYFRDPDGTVTAKSASLLVAASGTAYYDSSTTDVVTEGRWHRAWRVVQGSIDITSFADSFMVKPRLSV